MEYDEIDRYVDQLFRDEGDKPDKPEVLSGDWRIDRIDRIDEIIQDTYDEAIWWHNNRISEGTDPRSGLRSLPYIPWDERIDGQAAMMGNAGINESSYERSGGQSWQHSTHTRPAKKQRGMTVTEIVFIAFVMLGLIMYMAVRG